MKTGMSYMLSLPSSVIDPFKMERAIFIYNKSQIILIDQIFHLGRMGFSKFSVISGSHCVDCIATNRLG